MCGLIGFLGGGVSAGSEEALLRHMSDTLIHRGPDDSGYWYDGEVRIGLGHRRLSIIDLSSAGRQPMVSKSGRYVIAFNGEIYNHLALRDKIKEESCQVLDFRGHSDTETLLAGFEAWGIEEMLKKTLGMFAIALWDRKEKVLTLARDRMGEKPLYYGFQKNTFLFCSQLKALKVHPDFLGEIDRDVICLYLRHCYIPAPYSIYKGIKKLLPGTYLQLPIGSDIDGSVDVSPKEYWSLAEVAAQGLETPFVGSDADAIAALDDQLRQSIGLQTLADVPLGAFLSGGVDSSTVVALMQAQSDRPVKTFSIGFDEASYNEAEFAKTVAHHLGTDHTELYVTFSEAMQVIPALGRMYDEPFADSSQIPTFLVSQLARQHVTVALSGDGGDELFYGYNSSYIANNWENVERIPFGIRKMTGRLVKTVSQNTLGAYIRQSNNTNRQLVNISERLGNLSSRLETVDSLSKLIYSLSSVIEDPEYVVIGAKEPETWLKTAGVNLDFDNNKMQLMLIAAKTYLPDDILVKVDRAAMANSLETRVPLLDHRLVELAWRLPLSMKIREGKTKWILRQVLYQYVPQHLIERPKAGFSIPLGEWLRDSLREWAEELLDEHRLRQEGFFNVDFVLTKWKLHLARKQNNQSLLWSILMFQLWLDAQ